MNDILGNNASTLTARDVTPHIVHAKPSDDLAIRVRGLVKKYKIYSRPLDVVKEVFLRKPHHTAFAALNDVSFDVAKGEVVGIMGRNGAGKSTLLKILTGVLDYDAGDIDIDGNVAAILELGVGINPEYSGLDNIIYGTMVRGYTRDEAEAMVDDIVKFSELRAIIDRPFRTYSSGQKSRLLFSIAIAVDADILIIDEALAAGDILFAEKCFRRIKEITSSGRTVLFVTHALGQIYDLCDRALLMHSGWLMADGEPREVGYRYEALLSEARGGVAEESSNSHRGVQQLAAEIKSIDVVNLNEIPVVTLHYGQTYKVRITVATHEDFDDLSVGFRVEKLSGLVVFGTSTPLMGRKIPAKAGEEFSVWFTFTCCFGSGDFVLGGGLAQMEGTDYRMVQVKRNAYAFSTIGNNRFSGLYDVPVELEIEMNNDDA